jgi:hypothetical protein
MDESGKQRETDIPTAEPTSNLTEVSKSTKENGSLFLSLVLTSLHIFDIHTQQRNGTTRRFREARCCSTVGTWIGRALCCNSGPQVPQVIKSLHMFR